MDDKAIEITTSTETDAEAAAIAAMVRATMPRQRVASSIVAAQYGLILEGREIKRRVAETLPARQLGHWFKSQRYAFCARPEDYRAWIPDKALIVLHEARQARLFQTFCIMFPTYDFDESRRQHRADPHTDPWLIGWTHAEYSQLHESNHDFYQHSCHNRDQGIVLAYWDDATIHPPQAK